MCIGIVEPDPEELVMMDPFLGIGHAAVAARNAGVGRFIGFEIDEAYFREAEERLAVDRDTPAPHSTRKPKQGKAVLQSERRPSND